MSENFETAFRAYAERVDNPEAEEPSRASERKPSTRAASLPSTLLIFDTETTVDTAQSLNFLVYRLCRLRYGKSETEYETEEEGIVYADDLPERDPEGYETLAVYAQLYRADTSAIYSRRLRFYSQREWLEKVFYKYACKKPGRQAAVVGFNLPFDISRVAYDWREARTNGYVDGFSFVLFQDERDGKVRDNPYRPRIVVKHLDSRKAMISLTGAWNGRPRGSGNGKEVYRGRFIDLRQLGFALTNEAGSLRDTAESWGCEVNKLEPGEHGVITEEYIDYARRDVEVTHRLAEKMLGEYRLHKLPVAPWHLYSPASMGKGYLKAMGITPILERQPDFDRRILGYAMAAFYGGRAECRIRRTPVPVSYCDFTSMYPTVCSLMGVWGAFTAETVKADETVTKDVQALLDRVDIDACFDPAMWAGLLTLVQIRPDGDILPLRAKYDGSAWGIGSSRVTSDEPLWYTLADVIASKILTGRSPTIIRAIRFVGEGKAPGMRSRKLRGRVQVDPASEDFFRLVIEERKRVGGRIGEYEHLPESERIQLAGGGKLPGFLKIMANSTSYGIFAEFVQHDLPGKTTEKVNVYGLDAFSTRVSKPEEPGRFCFPPIAACITGAARLMLAMAEYMVTAAGGSYVFCDTDSMAIVASKEGGLIPCLNGPHRNAAGEACVKALDHSTVEAIRARFAALNPYDSAIVPGSIFRDEGKGEQQLWAYSISAKRYVLYTIDSTGEPTIADYSEHGLGLYLNPSDPDSDNRSWAKDLWLWILGEALGRPISEPDWFWKPVVMRIPIATPHAIRPFEKHNRRLTYAKSVKPFGFMMAANLPLIQRAYATKPLRLVAPFNSDSRKWKRTKWRNLYDATEQFTIDWPRDRIDMEEFGAYVVTGQFTVECFEAMARQYGHNKEHKSAGGEGLLARRDVMVSREGRRVIGKEANRIEEKVMQILERGASPVLDYTRQLTCRHCGESLVNHRRDSEYCSAGCRQGAYVRRQRAAPKRITPIPGTELVLCKF